MRPGQQNKRGRGRNNNNGGGNFNRKGTNPLTRTYDSSGPDVKIRGTAQHIAEKYAALARDAQSAGDRVMAENYLQHAEHYNRIIAAAQAQMQDRFQRDERADITDRDYADRDDDLDMMDEPAAAVPAHAPAQKQQHQPPVEIAGSGPQPVIEELPAAPEAGAAGQAEEQTEQRSRRRSPASRPRRQPRRTNGANGAAEAENTEAHARDDAAAGQPAMATVSE